ncbi:MAG TPA: DMT family transporter, partial [Thermoplasmata archaeon]|nr:DMT family transporter [Thermoplasmata archaeon]
MRPEGEHARAYFAIAVAMVSISFASIFIKWSESPPFVLASYRLGLTCLILLPILVYTGGHKTILSFRRDEWAIVLLSGVALSFHFGLWIVSLSLTLVSTSVILVTSHPIFVASVSHFIMKEHVRKVAAVGIVIAFTGVCVISLNDYAAGGSSLLGDLLAFVGGLCAGVYFLSGRVARRTMPLTPYVFSVYGISAFILLVSAVAVGDDYIVTDGRELTLFLLLAIIPTIFGHTMFNYALKKVPAHIVSTSVLGEPVGASLLAYLLLPGEVPGAWIILGGALVVGGLYIVLTRGMP